MPDKSNPALAGFRLLDTDLTDPGIYRGAHAAVRLLLALFEGQPLEQHENIVRGLLANLETLPPQKLISPWQPPYPG